MDHLFRGRWSRFRDVLLDPDTDLHVPVLCDVEVAAALRRALVRGDVSEERAAEALADYLDLPLIRHPHASLLQRVLQLRHNFSAYDAAYVALAERLGAAVATLDERLRRGITSHLDLELV